LPISVYLKNYIKKTTIIML